MHYAYFESLGKITGQEVAILGYIDPLVAVLFSYFVFHESLTITQGVGVLWFWDLLYGTRSLNRQVREFQSIVMEKFLK